MATEDPKVVSVEVAGDEKPAADTTKDYKDKDLRPSELLQQEEDEQNAEKPMVPLGELFQYADGTDKALMIIGGVSAFLAGGSMPGFSEVFGRMINKLIENPEDVEEEMAKLAVIMVYVGLGVWFFSTLQVACYMVSASRQITRIRKLYFEATLCQEMAWHDENKPGALAARLSGDIRVVQQGINDKLSGGIMNFGMFVLGYAFGFWRSWELTLVMLGMMPIIAAAGGIMGNVLVEMTTMTRRGFASAGDIATEAFDNVRSVQVYGNSEHHVNLFAAMLAPAKAAGIKKEFAAVGGVGVSYGIMFASYSVAFWFASYLIEWGRSDVGDVTAVFFSVLMGSMGVGLIFPSLAALSEARAAAYTIYNIINREVPIDIRSSGQEVDGLRESIEFRDVAFSYPTRKDMKLFSSLNVTIKRGEKVAFSGASGSGKSSIVALLQRFYDPDEGGVFVDGVDMKTLSLKSWRSHIGIVSQEPNLFSGTISENIRIGKADATDEEVIEACKKANVHGTIMTLPKQYDTPVGSVGSQLSGGQKQRLAIARAIIKNPQLLILDEATSALDRKSEVEVQAALDEVMTSSGGQKLTVVVIAHRLATIRNVDTIHYIAYDGEKGSRITESGTFDELMARGGEFAIMAQRQAKNAEALTSPNQQESAATNENAGGHVVSHGNNWTEGDGKGDGSNEGKEDDTPKTLEQIAQQEVEETEVPVDRIISYSNGKGWAIIIGMIGSLISGGLYPSYAVAFAKILEVLGTNANRPSQLREETPLWASVFIIIGAAAFIGWLLQGFYAIAGEEITEGVRTALFRNILRQDATFFDTPGRDSGALSGVLSGDTEAIHQLYGPSIGLKIQAGCNLLAGIVVAMIYSWKLSLVIMGCIPIMIIGGAVQQMLLVGFGKSVDEMNEDTVVAESLNNIRTVTSFNIQDSQGAVYTQLAEVEAPRMNRNGVIAGIVFGFSQFTFYGVFALAFWYGGKLMADGEVSFIDVMIASMAVLMGAMGAGEAGGFAGKIADAESAAKRVFAILDKAPPIDPTAGGKSVPPTLDIDLEKLQFDYPARPGASVLSGVSSKFSENSSVGLMGSTGCGKSTIMQMLCRFYDPDSGSITIGSGGDAVDLREVDLEQWRDQCAIVPQEPALFSGTVKENITYGLRRDVPDEEIEEAAKLAHIHEDVMGMPDHYDTDVGYKGRQLSGGQKQRVAIARALLRRPRLLLMDEATSALDNATEAKVMDGIDTAVKRHPMGIISIAHRLTTIEKSDMILLLDSGKIAEQGSHQQLMDLGGEYRQRYELFSQSMGMPEADAPKN